MTANQADEQLVVGRYARRERLGHGGFGVVWRAHDTLLQRDVAVKEVRFPSVLDQHEQARLREKVLREARAAARLSHPALVTVFDVVEEDGRPVIVMELVDAPNLAELVARDGPLPDPRAAAIGAEVLDALVAAHEENIIHRDVKPANVMVGANDRVQLADFGIASIIDDPKVTSSGELAGSPSFMAPEQAQNLTPTAATDLWGLGATLYYAVEGAPPFEKDGPIPTLASVVNDEPRPMTRATTLAPLLRDLLQKDPAQRPSAEETARRLHEVAMGSPAPAPAAVPGPSETVELDASLLREAGTGDPSETVGLDDRQPEPAAPPERPPEPREPEPALPRRWERPAPARVRRRDRLERRPSPTALLVAALALVFVVVAAVFAGREDAGGPATPKSASPEEAQEEAEQAAEASEDVPDDWVRYRDPTTGFTVRHPPDWTVTTNGTLTDFRDPATNAYLRIDYTASPGPSAEQAWREFEPRFAAENPNYRRIRLESTTYKGYPAAIWEFTYTAGGAPVRSADLGFITGRYGFALNFTTRTRDWADMQPVFDAFKASFTAPQS